MTEISNLPKIHPEHLHYLFRVQKVNLEFFFNLLEKMAPDKRDAILKIVYEGLFEIKTIFHTTPITVIPGNTPAYTYRVFKKKCYLLSKTLYDSFLVHSVVSFTLLTLYQHETQRQMQKRKYKQDIQQISRTIEQMVGKESSRTDQPVDTEMVRLLSIFERQKLEGMLDIIEQDLSEEELEEDSSKESKTYMLYQYFCREIVAPLNQIES